MNGDQRYIARASPRLDTPGSDGLDSAMILKEEKGTLTCPHGVYAVEHRDPVLVANRVDNGARVEKTKSLIRSVGCH